MTGDNYHSLDDIHGRQLTPYGTDFLFTWNLPQEKEAAVNYLWIYQENEVMPQMFPYSGCIGHQIHASFNTVAVALNEVRKVRFLIFGSAAGAAPPQDEISRMAGKSEYICEVCCGNAKIEWRWEMKKDSNSLIIDSNKNISEGLLFFAYPYGVNQIPTEFEIPGEIRQGKNRYDNIFFPETNYEPELFVRGENIQVIKKKKRWPFN